MKRIPLSLGSRSYEIAIGHGILPELGEALRRIKLGTKQMIVTSKTVWDLYGQTARDSLEASKFDVSVTQVSDDEEAKSLQSLTSILDRLLENEFDRTSGIVALGGGVIGDVAGFAAATFMRGIPYVQVPTTLLAQVDSSIGGKTGVNHPKAKNLIGVFHQPSLVWSDTSTLSSLPAKETRSGIAEIIKYSIIADETLFKLLSRSIESFVRIPRDTLIEIISGCCSIKARIIEEDERENGARSILNYGHTIGHALEALTAYTRYTHGEAIAVGMIAAARISREIGRTDQAMVESQQDMIKRASLPTAVPQTLDANEILRQLNKDKKRVGDRVRWVLPRKIGEVFLTDDVPADVVLKVLNGMQSSLEIEAGCA